MLQTGFMSTMGRLKERLGEYLYINILLINLNSEYCDDFYQAIQFPKGYYGRQFCACVLCHDS